MTNIVLYLLVGLIAGLFSGLIGIGGATIMIPALVLLFGLSQHMAQGTTLAMMVPPIGILAAWTYYKAGFVDFKIAAFLCLGFFIGGLLGAKFAIGIPGHILKKLFGIFLLIISLRMIFFK
ncbi:MAG: sulfite exporter TauE/SafE family protein [Phycisphaerae bacterium]|nr:sulfite exporter TauE/SafE family protein [Phycisphaerae bacterium]